MEGALSAPRAIPAATHAHWPALAGACALLVGWAVLMAGVHPAQFADSIEQYNWSHSLEWGYWKHPPLTTWLMAAAVALFGASHWTAPLLAAACLAATAGFIWSFARMLLGERAAQLAIVLWPLHEALTARADVFNHNRTLILVSAAVAWAALRAARSGRTRDWLLFGLCAGLGLLTKYQAAVTIAGTVVALFAGGVLRDTHARRHLLAAGGVALLVFMPHFLWLLNHSFPTLVYVETSAPHLDAAARLPALGGFAGAQLGMLAVTLAAAAAARYWPGEAAGPREWREGELAAVRPWMIGLVGVPLLALAAMVLVGGHKPQKMWGLHTTMFLPLWLAWHVERKRPQGALARHAAAVAAALTIVLAAVCVADAQHARATRPHAADRIIPAAELAHAALADWQRATRCPLRIVRGDPFAAGLVSLYSGVHAPVLEDGDFEKSPWIRAEDLAASGALDVHGPVEVASVPTGVSSLRVPAASKFHGPAAIWWHVIPPARECAAELSAP